MSPNNTTVKNHLDEKVFNSQYRSDLHEFYAGSTIGLLHMLFWIIVIKSLFPYSSKSNIVFSILEVVEVTLIGVIILLYVGIFLVGVNEMKHFGGLYTSSDSWDDVKLDLKYIFMVLLGVSVFSILLGLAPFGIPSIYVYIWRFIVGLVLLVTVFASVEIYKWSQ